MLSQTTQRGRGHFKPLLSLKVSVPSLAEILLIISNRIWLWHLKSHRGPSGKILEYQERQEEVGSRGLGSRDWGVEPFNQSPATMGTQLQELPDRSLFIPSSQVSVSCLALISYSQGSRVPWHGSGCISLSHVQVQLCWVKQLTHIAFTELWPWAPALNTHDVSPQYCVPYLAEIHQGNGLNWSSSGIWI